MARITLVYWRDIPAQVIVGRGRGAAKAPLPDRFAEAIDRAAMVAGLTGSDAYSAEWVRVDEGEVAGDAAEVANARARALDEAYDDARLRALVRAGGRG
ncbi:MAG: virulence factor [Rhodobacteraceae bacterium]|nr:virulence factor [Paracoccaceae bacterium]